MRQSSRRKQVCGARAGRGRAKHKSTAQVVLGISGRSKAHRLLVLTPVKRQRVLGIVKRLAQTAHVTMSENTKTTAANAGLLAINN